MGYYFVHALFINNLNRNIDITDIKKIEIEEDILDENIIEVVIEKLNGRKQNIKFRKLENQLEPFLNLLKKRNSRIIIENI